MESQQPIPGKSMMDALYGPLSYHGRPFLVDGATFCGWN